MGILRGLNGRREGLEMEGDEIKWQSGRGEV